MLQSWRGEPGSPGLVSRGFLLLLALFPPIAAGNWAAALATGDRAAMPSATLLMMAGALIAASYPYWLTSIWRVSNRVRIGQVRGRDHHGIAQPHIGLNARPADLPKRW